MKISTSDVIIIENNKVLLVQEKKRSAYGLWNFPGGKIEEGETPEEAACREIKEELGVELINAQFVKTYPVQHSNISFQLNAFTGSLQGNIKIKDDELLAYGWFSLESIEDMKDKLRSEIIIKQFNDALEPLE
ncbi:NUDIX hydrolase [Candidatus Saccharibacteria bacterium]|nr:NUDIX hydrolase [Candidatus Saccharibacteria bacterium]